MFARVLFVLLLATNLGLAAWLWLAPKPSVAALPVTDPGVPQLVLLSEQMGGPAAAAEMAEAPMAPTDLARLSCTQLGPFGTQADLRRTMNALTPRVDRVQFRETRTTRSRGWWVYLPAFKDRSEALSAARNLSEKGIRDYYVVTAGDQQNTISLGLFRARENADRRVAELQGLGFAPSMTERTDELPEYWLEFAVVAGAPFNWRDVVPDTTDLVATPIECR
ncbi:SPOR domain-containing protein [Ahniella affigens]|uniref:SPOR domain-containing protein n=1 Tax=Ahniella affigens TaxID=2021234 RepID=A0A2P1PR95_9GAMM|nr:SPOR domain-containing protein [Ahniella affigens]AVP97376.1 SPOR domain-containing protein [Ahniella affigens]